MPRLAKKPLWSEVSYEGRSISEMSSSATAGPLNKVLRSGGPPCVLQVEVFFLAIICKTAPLIGYKSYGSRSIGCFIL